MSKLLSVLLLSVSIFLNLSCSTIERNFSPQDYYFKNMKGCFLLYNMKTNEFDKVIGEENCKERFVACSSFKVPLAVMAFDSGVLKNENQMMKWDGKKGDREVLNQDHNAKTWMRDSVVWFSQRLTPQIGEKRVKKYLAAFHYGNEDLTGGLTQAWLVPPSVESAALKISAYEQVEFMKNLWSDQLPASKRAMRLTREITYLEDSPKGFKVSGKTGSNTYNKNPKVRLGWFIAHVANREKEYIAVTNINDLLPAEDDLYGGMEAKEITKKILADQGLW